MKEIRIWLFAAEDDFSKRLSTKIEESEDFAITKFIKKTEDLFLWLENEVPCLLFLDFELTGVKKGIKCIKDITASYKSAKIIMILTEENDKVIYSGICSGAYDYYVKNENIDGFREKLFEVLNSDNPLRSLLNNKVKKSFNNVNLIENAYHLTQREREILDLLISGITKRKMAERMVLSFHTIDSHLRNIYRKLGVQSKSQAISKALKEQLVVSE